VRGHNLLCEYWGNAQATAEALRDGWYLSGDLGTRDADGHFFIHDRKKNLIISGGENIYPAEVERVLASHPALFDAAVVGRPDARWQEVPVAYVIARADATVTTSIAGTAITGGAFVITQSSSAIGDLDAASVSGTVANGVAANATITAANTCLEGDVIKFAMTGSGTAGGTVHCYAVVVRS